jgi:hypothetical protein
MKTIIARYPDLRKLRSRALDQSCKDATNYDTARQWFDLFLTIRLLYNLSDEDIYHMDEKGCMKGVGENVKVFVLRSKAKPFQHSLAIENRSTPIFSRVL